MRSWKLGTVFGIGVFVHWSFLLLPAIVLLGNLESGLALALHYLTLLIAVFGCVVLHELGHALTARRFGIPTRDITLYPIGGVARLERISEKPWEEFWIAVAGPAVNVVIGTVLFAILLLTGTFQAIIEQSGSVSFVQMFLGELLAINIFMILFNMLPAFPMDGGRVLRAILASFMDYVKATEVAATIGIVMAGLFAMVGLGLFPIFPGQPPIMLAVVGLFVFIAGQSELAMVRRNARDRGVRTASPWQAAAGDLVKLNQTPYREDSAIQMQGIRAGALPQQPDFNGFTWDSQARAWIQWRDGKPTNICWVE